MIKPEFKNIVCNYEIVLKLLMIILDNIFIQIN